MLYVIGPNSPSKSPAQGDSLTIVNNGVLGLVYNTGTNFGLQIGLPSGGMGSASYGAAIGK